jgi:diacylglycerol O-acyltransferase
VIREDSLKPWNALLDEVSVPLPLTGHHLPRQVFGALAMRAKRLSPLDASFLALESSGAHMHVGWSAVLAVPDEGDRPTLRALRERVAGRLDDLPWCRWRLQRAPLGISEPRWVEDREFDLAAHVRALAEPDEPVSYPRFAELRDALLSEPLDRSRAPWQICLVPRLEDGRVALLGKIHHSLVDGIAALQIVNLVLDNPPDSKRMLSPSFSTSGEQGPTGWAIDELRHTARSGLEAIRGAAGAATHPYASARTALRDARRMLSAARTDILPRAPDSALNAPIGDGRTLVGFRASRSDLRDARAGGGTLNEIGLTLVAGALRALALRRGEPPAAPLKVMVPVSMRRADETGPGNRISMVYVALPVERESPVGRLEAVRAQMHALKASSRPEGTEMLYALGGLLPAPLRSHVAKALVSPRIFNLTISQSPGPRGTVQVLGCEMQEVYSVVPIPERHSLAIGMVRYRNELFIGCYADPEALPEVRELPALLDAELQALARRASRRSVPGDPARARGPGRLTGA